MTAFRCCIGEVYCDCFRAVASYVALWLWYNRIACLKSISKMLTKDEELVAGSGNNYSACFICCAISQCIYSHLVVFFSFFLFCCLRFGFCVLHFLFLNIWIVLPIDYCTMRCRRGAHTNVNQSNRNIIRDRFELQRGNRWEFFQRWGALLGCRLGFHRRIPARNAQTNWLEWRGELWGTVSDGEGDIFVFFLLNR